MKKAIRKIMALSLVLIMAIGLCACSSNEPAKNNDTNVTTEVTPEPTKETRLRQLLRLQQSLPLRRLRSPI